MLINFTVANFRSIKEPVTLDMEAMGQVSELPDNVIAAPRHKLLKTAVIYGANGSGKSNILRALQSVVNFVLNSIRSQEGEAISFVEPFALAENDSSKASFFEIEFLADTTKYRYGFEVSQQAVEAEWLYALPKGKRKEHELFLRESQVIDVSEKYFKEGLGIEDKVRNNALFISVCAQFNGKVSKQIINFCKNINIIFGVEDRQLRNFTSNFMKEPTNFKVIMAALQQADFGIENITEEQPFVDRGPNNLPSDLPDNIKDEIQTTKVLFSERNRFNSAGEAIGMAKLVFDNTESAGTQKYFHLLGPIQDTLLQGRILCIDELDARLHPKLTLNLIRMFNNKTINKNGAQLIFATHDTNLLSSGLFRRDQIFFTEKNQVAATDLYSLAEFKLADKSSVRKDANYEKNYLKGRYGAIPFMGSLEFMKLFQQ
jgi:AAA15 family ATPase/GTPase